MFLHKRNENLPKKEGRVMSSKAAHPSTYFRLPWGTGKGEIGIDIP
jgi:hypothetical protein